MKPVLVTTQHRGVFFGYLNGEPPRELPTNLTLQRARNCIYWSSDVRGFLGLAITGPSENCRIGPAVGELTLYDLTSVAAVTDEAKERWEAAPWRT